MVALERGAEFEIKPLEWNIMMPRTFADHDIAEKALRDVSKWLGFRSNISYQHALEKEGPDVFKRAP